jgi:hypothetical protein
LWLKRRSRVRAPSVTLLLGLDMPTKHASTDPTGQKEYKGGIPEEFKKRILEQRRREAEEATVVDHEPLN